VNDSPPRSEGGSEREVDGEGDFRDSDRERERECVLIGVVPLLMEGSFLGVLQSCRRVRGEGRDFLEGSADLNLRHWG